MPPPGKQHCGDDGDGELTINYARNPPKKAIGRNTADNTSAMATVRQKSRPLIFPWLHARATLRTHNAFDVLYHHNGIVHQQAVASTIANNVRVLIE